MKGTSLAISALLMSAIPVLAHASAGSEMEYALDGCKNGDYQQYTTYRDKAYALDKSIKNSKEIRAGFVVADGVKECDAKAAGAGKAAAAWAANGLQGDAVYDAQSLDSRCQVTQEPHAGQSEAAKLTFKEASKGWDETMADWYRKYPGTQNKLMSKDSPRTIAMMDAECRKKIATKVAELNAWGKGVVAQQEKVAGEVMARHKASEAADAAREAAVKKLLTGKKLEIFDQKGIPSQIVPNTGATPQDIARAHTWIYKVGNQKHVQIQDSKGRKLGSARTNFKWCVTTYVFSGNSAKVSERDCD